MQLSFPSETVGVPEVPPYYHPLRPNMHRRAFWHDYTAPGSYLLTLTKQQDIPRFSHIIGSEIVGAVEAAVRLTSVGEALEAALRAHVHEYPMVEIT